MDIGNIEGGKTTEAFGKRKRKKKMRYKTFEGHMDDF